VSEPRRPGGPGHADLDPVTSELGRALAEARAREPDDVTLRRMWARVSQPELQVPEPAAHPPRWLWFAGGVATTAALAVGATLWLLPRFDAKHTPIVAARPAMTETRMTPATEGTVRTGAGERLNLSLAGGTEARLEASTVMRIDRGGRPSVDGGEVSFSVPHPRTGHSYVVFAGPYRVVLAGSKFRLRLDDTRRVFIEAQEGRVEVWDRARLASLSPGESWASPATATPETSLVPPDAPVRVHVHPAAPTPSVKGDEAGAAAQAALAAGDVPKALGLYRALAKSGGPAGENASYEVGKILRDRLSQPAAAIAAWRRYRTDHPSGVLRVEADVSIIETLVHGGDATGALAEANDFIRNHPDSERRAEIARVAGDLYRTRADYKRAVASYQIALASPQLRDAAEPASFHRAECLVRLGDPNGTEAARAYLRRWPNGRFRTEAERLLESGDDTGATRL
jgi:hypothetical protein